MPSELDTFVAIFWLLTRPPGLSISRSNIDGSAGSGVHLTVMGCVGSSASPSAGDVKVKARDVAATAPKDMIETRIMR